MGRHGSSRYDGRSGAPKKKEYLHVKNKLAKPGFSAKAANEKGNVSACDTGGNLN